MVKDNSLQFLKNKIHEIKYAMFRAEMESELQLPNNIITTLKTDDEGNVWFFTSFKGVYAANIDQHFFAYLDYHKKGQDGRLRLNGRASIVHEAANIESEPLAPHAAPAMQLVLIKFKILHAEYTGNRPTETATVKDKLKTFLSEIFVSQNHRVYDFT